MDPIYHDIYVDIGGSSKNKTKVFPIRLVKDDTGLNYFKIYVQKDKEAFDLTGVTRATMTFLREDGEEFVDDCTIESAANGILTKQVKTDETAYPGYVTISVELYEDTGRTTSSMAKFLAIDDLSSDVPVTSSDNYPVLTSLIADTTDAIAGAEAAAISANTASTIATSAANSANTATAGVNAAVTNAETATSTMNELISSVTNDESTRSTNESGRVSAEGARVTAETSRASAEASRATTFTSNEAERQSTFETNEATRESNETERITSEDERLAHETSRVSAESSRVSAENARVSAESSRASAEDTRVSEENTRQSQESSRVISENVRLSNETARVSSENTRIANEATRVIEFNDLVEFAMLTESSNGALSMTTENDTEGRLVKKVFTDSNSVIRKTVERLNFNADDYPQEIRDKTFDAVAKGDKYYDHIVTYAVDGGITQDTVTEIPYTSVDLSVTRAGKVFNPLEAVNPESLTIFDNNVLSGYAQDATVNVANNDSAVEIIGEKILDTFKNSNGVQQTVATTKVPFVGGDTQSVEYKIIDGYLLTNPNRTVKVKYYPGGINVDAAPIPEDVNWTELTQAEVDKLKLNNEYPVTATDFTGRTATVNGVPVVAQSASIPAIRDDFAGKVAGSTVVNPNKSYFSRTNSLQNPNNITNNVATGWQESSPADYTNQSVQGGSVNDNGTTVNGAIPQILLSFNLIREVEDKYGTIPGSTTAEKVAWLKSNANNIVLKSWIRGVCSTGNKAYVAIYQANLTWYSNWNTTSSTITVVETTSINVNNIDVNGMLNFAVYTDASDGVTPSTVYLDYASIDISFKAPSTDYEILVPTTPRRDAGLGYAVAMEKAPVNMTSYNPATWAEWGDKTSGVVGDSTGLEFTISSSTLQYATNSATYKPSTKYGILLNIVSNAMSATNLVMNNNLTGTYPVIVNVGETGNKKNTFTTQATITTNNLRLRQNTLGDNGLKVKFKDIRVYELPTGSQIETDFTNLTADALATKYPFANTGATLEAFNFFTNNSVEVENVIASKAPALLIECDMSSVARDLCGGSNAALKALLKGITVDAYAMGSGASGGQLAYGCYMKYINNVSGVWNNLALSTVNSVTKVTTTQDGNFMRTYNVFTPSNKIYILVHAQYASDGTIPSSLSLDNFNVKVDLTRVMDIPQPIIIYL